MLCVGLRCVIVVFPDHTHLLFGIAFRHQTVIITDNLRFYLSIFVFSLAPPISNILRTTNLFSSFHLSKFDSIVSL